MPDQSTFLAALATVPVRRLRAELVRCVALAPLSAGGAPDYLFASGKPNRFSPAGVACVYFSEEERTARAEYGRRLGRAARQPLGTFFAEVDLTRVLDLSEAQTLKTLNLKPRDLALAWQTGRCAIKTQSLGLAVSKTGSVAAIRFPSDAARASGFVGFNLVIFQDSVIAPDYVHILGPTKKPLQKWP